MSPRPKHKRWEWYGAEKGGVFQASDGKAACFSPWCAACSFTLSFTTCWFLELQSSADSPIPLLRTSETSTIHTQDDLKAMGSLRFSWGPFGADKDPTNKLGTTCCAPSVGEGCEGCRRVQQHLCHSWRAAPRGGENREERGATGDKGGGYRGGLLSPA
uniref:Uncharacterized protein n=1 Tax=Knipowitschia caucasica TaxID=637954 RepID=A0AAV2JED9_KNICA